MRTTCEWRASSAGSWQCSDAGAMTDAVAAAAGNGRSERMELKGRRKGEVKDEDGRPWASRLPPWGSGGRGDDAKAALVSGDGARFRRGGQTRGGATGVVGGGWSQSELVEEDAGAWLCDDSGGGGRLLQRWCRLALGPIGGRGARAHMRRWSGQLIGGRCVGGGRTKAAHGRREVGGRRREVLGCCWRWRRGRCRSGWRQCSGRRRRRAGHRRCGHCCR